MMVLTTVASTSDLMDLQKLIHPPCFSVLPANE
jgi:hypothetical protein